MSSLSTFYTLLKRHIMSEKLFVMYEYPRPDPVTPGKAKLVLHPQSCMKVVPGPNKRNCQRCGVIYEINSDGRPTAAEECRWHNKCRPKGNVYVCCGRSLSSRPCNTSPQHVNSDIDLENLAGFIDLSQSNVAETNIFALDCEMVSTTNGYEVAAITVVNHQCQVVYETMVLPDNPIIDYNTVFSGITANDLKGIETKLSDVHAKLLSLMGVHTILVGHSLQNDLLRLRLLHGRVVDTAVIFPHPKGLPFRQALSYLKRKFLPRFIKPCLKCQEDAVATMMLARMKCGLNPSP